MAIRSRTDPQGRQRYDIEFQQRGRRVFERCPPATTLAQAREREQALRREAFDSDTLGRKPEVLLAEVIQAWLSTKPHRNHRQLVNIANQWVPFIQGKRLIHAPEVAATAISTWNGAQSTTKGSTNGESAKRVPLSPATINRRLAVLKAALTHHGRPDLGKRIKLRREQNGREVYLTREEVRTLASNAPTATVRAAIFVAAYSGLRASELLAITNTSLQGLTLSVAKSKNGKPRIVPVPALLRRHLRALPLGLDYWQLQRGFSAARKAAGLGPEVTFHTLRHTYASWMINAGVDIMTLSKLLGHSSVLVTQRYAHLYDSTLRDAVKRLR